MDELRVMLEAGVVRGEWWHSLEDGRVQCDLCPRNCKLRDGQRGFCFVRQARDGGMVLTSYGRNTGMAIDPIEKKPLNHFYPGSRVLSFGTAGCNLGCKFCQNWDISKAREMRRLSVEASPDQLADQAARLDCQSIAFTYNDPTIFAEYAIDSAQAAHAAGLSSVAVTAGYITEQARPDFYRHMDAANVDLKGFTHRFYHELCYGDLDPVLDTLSWLHNQSDTWFEITTLLIPGQNDSVEEIEREVDWILENIGPDVPLHFTAFHPDFKMNDIPPTPIARIQRARQQAVQAGMHYVYTGNILDEEGSSTYCPDCGQVVIGRIGYQITAWNLDVTGACSNCGAQIPGRFAPEGPPLLGWSPAQRRIIAR
ncbi:MAG: AmmeMemoRadiSam system radical SAM enzyme [Anaerolineales bacterium]